MFHLDVSSASKLIVNTSDDTRVLGERSRYSRFQRLAAGGAFFQDCRSSIASPNKASKARPSQRTARTRSLKMACVELRVDIGTVARSR